MEKDTRDLVMHVLSERQRTFNNEHEQQVFRQERVLGMMEALNLLDNVVIGPWLQPDYTPDKPNGAA